MSKRIYSIILIISLLLGTILYFIKDQFSGEVMLTILFIVSMVSVASTHGIIAYATNNQNPKDLIKFPLLMGAVFAVMFFIWVFFIIPLFCPDFIGNLK
jgi:hypothetical protein